MLSGETASGNYPVESLKTMVRIAETTESDICYRDRFAKKSFDSGSNITNAISYATCTTAHSLHARAILALSNSGKTALMVARFQPETMILAVTPLLKTYCKLALCWGVTPLLSEEKCTPNEVIADAASRVLKAGLALKDDLVVITGSSAPGVKFTDMLQAHHLE
jgi:pyruvate kinase